MLPCLHGAEDADVACEVPVPFFALASLIQRRSTVQWPLMHQEVSECLSRGRSEDARTHKVTTLKVEAVQLIACLLRVRDVLVDHKRGSLGIAGDALTDLTDLQ